MPEPIIEQHYSARAAASRCSVSLSTIRRAIARRDLRTILIGRRRLIPASSLLNFLSERTIGKTDD